MKFKVTLKDPDGFFDGVQDAVTQQLLILDLPEDEREALHDVKQEKIMEFIDKWVEYSEYVTIEFDTEANTATVLPRR